MRVTTLTLHQFRSYAQLSLSLAPGVNALVGDNAMGKTNILEAIYCCCVGRSHRAGHDAELVQKPHNQAGITLAYESAFGKGEIALQLFTRDRKKILIDGQPVRRLGELYGHLACVLFCPEDLQLVTGSPAGRRTYMDIALSQTYPAYFYQLQAYQHILQQRNALLKELAANPGQDTLWMWDEKLAEAGAQVMTRRSAFLQPLADAAAAVHRDISGENFSLEYQPNVADPTQLLQALHQAHAADLARGSTTVGPHRDDIVLHVQGLPARQYASQGQQRTAALALRIAELCTLHDVLSQWPLLLLDDVFSELDAKRRDSLLRLLPHVQTLITGTDPQELIQLEDATVFRVNHGGLEEL